MLSLSVVISRYSRAILFLVFAGVLSSCSGGGGGGGGAAPAPTPSVPADPAALTAASASSSAINLTWADNSTDESGFRIERSTSATTGFTEIATVAADVTDYSASGLTASTTYYFRVRAYNGVGNSGYSNTANATTQAPAATAPTAPTTLVATASSSNAIALSWSDNSNNETGFRVERSTSATTGFAEIATVGAGVSSYSASGLTASTTYYFRVRAYNGVGNSGYSNTANATTQAPAATIPSAPTNLKANTVYINSTDLVWTDNSSDETGFKIERSLSSATGFTQVGTVAANISGYSATGLTSSTTYYFRVTAYNAVGNSVYTNTKSITTAASAPSLSAPSSSPANTDFTLSWTYSWGAGGLLSSTQDGFELQRSSTSSTSGFSTIWTVTNDRSPSAQVSDNLASAGTYWYRIRARHNTVYSSWSNVVSVSVTAPGATLRIINDLYDTTDGAGNLWGTWNRLIRVRIAATEAQVTTPGNTYEKLTPADSITTTQYTNGYAQIINPDYTAPYAVGSYKDFDVSGFGGSTYWVYLQAGWWEYVCYLGVCSWDKHMSQVYGCDNVTPYYKNSWFWVSGHVSGTFTVYASDFLPHFAWFGSPWCP